MKDNYVMISGTLVTDFKLSHTSYGNRFYEAFLASERTSGYQDKNRIIAEESMIGDFQKGDKIRLTGEYRSSDWTDRSGKQHKKLYVFAQELHPFEYDENIIILEGYVCKPPQKRSTPNGFLIADLILAVNRKNGRSDYIPCIVWGGSAKRAEQLKVGDHIKLKGRIQSRVYQKQYDPQKYVAYEISGEDFEIMEQTVTSGSRNHV